MCTGNQSACLLLGIIAFTFGTITLIFSIFQLYSKTFKTTAGFQRIVRYTSPLISFSFYGWFLTIFDVNRISYLYILGGLLISLTQNLFIRNTGMYCYYYVETVYHLHRKELSLKIKKFYEISGIFAILSGQFCTFFQLYYNVIWPLLPGTLFCIIKFICDVCMTWYFYWNMENWAIRQIGLKIGNEVEHKQNPTLQSRLRKLRLTLYTISFGVGCGVMFLMYLVVRDLENPFGKFNVPISWVSFTALFILIGGHLITLYLGGPVIVTHEMEDSTVPVSISIPTKETEKNCDSRTSNLNPLELSVPNAPITAEERGISSSIDGTTSFIQSPSLYPLLPALEEKEEVFVV